MSVEAKLYLCRTEAKSAVDVSLAAVQHKAPEVCLVSSVQRRSSLGLSRVFVSVVEF